MILSHGLKIRVLALSSAAVFALQAGQIHAAEETLDAAGAYDENEIIVTGEKDGYLAISSAGLKTPTPLIDTPQTVSVVTREQLDDQALQDIGDILRYTPGASTGQGEGNRDQVTIRGQNTTADFFVDGIRDDVQYFRPLYNIERVEIHKGPNAMIFGRGGGGGTINRVSKSPVADDTFGSATASVDTFGAHYVSADLNAAIAEGAAFRINGLYERFDNHRDFFDGERFAINPVIAGELDDRSRILFSYEYVDDDRVVDRGIPSLNNAPISGFRDTFFGIPGINQTTLQAHILKLRVEHDLNDNLTFSSTTQYADYDKLYQNVYPVGVTLNDPAFGGADSVTLDSYGDTTDRENFITQGNLVYTGDTGGIGHTLLLGYELGQQKSDNRRRDGLFAASNDDQIAIALMDPIAQPVVTFPVFNRNRQSDLKFISLYAQDQISLSDQFDVVVGLRFDNFDIHVVDQIEVADGAADGNSGFLSRTDDKFSPRVGLIYKPMENISIYASYSKSFLPRSGDQFLSLTPNEAGLEPESFDNYEFGAKWDIRPDLSLTAALFRLDRDNQSQPIDDQGNAQLTGSRTEGFEIQLVGSLMKGWHTNVGYSYLDANERIGGNDAGRLGQVPRHQASMWNRYDFTEQFGVGLGVTHQSSQLALTGTSVRIPAYTRIDAAVYYKVSEQFKLQANIENLFDEGYFPSVHNDNNISTGEPINGRITATLSF